MMYIQLQAIVQVDYDCKSQDSEVLFRLAQRFISNYGILVNIVDNMYANTETLDYIVEKTLHNYSPKSITQKLTNEEEALRIRDWISLMKRLAQRSDLSCKSSYMLVSSLRWIPAVIKELSKFTKYEAIRRQIVMVDDNDRTVINILRKTTTKSVLNKYIKQLGENKLGQTDVHLINYLSRCIQANPNLQSEQMLELVYSGNAIPELMVKHPNFNEDVLKALLSTMKLSDVDTRTAVALVSIPMIANYEAVIKLILLIRNINLEKLIEAILDNLWISDEVINHVINTYTGLIANNESLFEKTFLNCKNVMLLKKVVYSANSLNAKNIEVIFRFLPSTELEGLYGFICDKAKANNLLTVKAFIRFIPEQYWTAFYKKSYIKFVTCMVQDDRCPKEVLANVATSRNYENLILVGNNKNCNLEIASTIYKVIVSSKSLRINERMDIFKVIYSKFGDELLNYVWNDSTTDYELYKIFQIVPQNVKVKIAERISGKYYIRVKNYAIKNEDVDLCLALKRNVDFT